MKKKEQNMDLEIIDLEFRRDMWRFAFFILLIFTIFSTSFFIHYEKKAIALEIDNHGLQSELQHAYESKLNLQDNLNNKIKSLTTEIAHLKPIEYNKSFIPVNPFDYKIEGCDGFDTLKETVTCLQQKFSYNLFYAPMADVGRSAQWLLENGYDCYQSFRFFEHNLYSQRNGYKVEQLHIKIGPRGGEYCIIEALENPYCVTLASAEEINTTETWNDHIVTLAWRENDRNI